MAKVMKAKKQKPMSVMKAKRPGASSFTKAKNAGSSKVMKAKRMKPQKVMTTKKESDGSSMDYKEVGMVNPRSAMEDGFTVKDMSAKERASRVTSIEPSVSSGTKTDNSMTPEDYMIRDKKTLEN